MKTLITITLLLFSVTLISGCGSSGVSVVSVSGTVSYNGSPVAGAVVSLIPLSDGGRGASGTTENDGTFVAMTQGADKNGAVPGEYAVVVTKIVPVDAAGKEIVYAAESEAFDPRKVGGSETRPEIKNLLPEKYADKETSGLNFTVKKGKNVCTLTLTD